MRYLHERRTADADTVDIRWLELDRVAPDHWPLLEALLDAEERARARRFHFERDRLAYIAGHALVRAMLTEYAPMAPFDWQYIVNAHGKPEAVAPVGLPRFRVNLSHTRGLAAVALTVDHDVGVDVEWLARDSLTLGLADRFFAPDEVAILKALPVDGVKEGLFAFWTLKEAFIKAVGVGLSMPLDSFAFTLEPLAVSLPPGPDAAPEKWLFRRLWPTPAHAMALALRHPDPSRVTVTARPADPAGLIARAS